MKVIVVGAGVFGATASLELKRRGHEVQLFDQGPLPYPDAASTDISKICRMEYGGDHFYMDLMEQALQGWLLWNEAWKAKNRPRLFHQTGILYLTKAAMAPGDFEYQSFTHLLERGRKPVRLQGQDIQQRFPAWSDIFVDGFFHEWAGYAESGRVVSALLDDARELGVEVLPQHPVRSLLEKDACVYGVRVAEKDFHADHVVVAAGAWTSKLIPELKEELKATGHPVFHLRPKDPSLFRAERFPVFTGDITRTGFYGFPINQDGIVKIATHGLGAVVDVDDPRELTEDHEQQRRDFVEQALPALRDAPVVGRRLCLYSDTRDEHFWLARHPGKTGLTVATGGSGHGFKFAPLMGTLISDVVEDRKEQTHPRFSWRGRESRGQEEARSRLVE